jgi:hypothetical protein
LFCGEETEATVCETADDDGAAEPKMDVGEPAAFCGFIFNISVMVVPAEECLDNCRYEDSSAEEVI